MSLDIFLMSLNWEQYQSLPPADEIPERHHPLLCWDIASAAHANTAEYCPDELLHIAVTYGWQEQLKHILNASYQALVLTCAERIIRYTDKGFEHMTGYSSAFALGRKPTFLQGANTSNETLNYIRTQLSAGVPCSASLTNYRKDGSAYECRIEVFPLLSNKRITHFIALENEII